AAARRAASVDTGETVIVGVNRYKLDEEPDIDILDIDNARVRRSQIERINDVRAKRDDAKVTEALEALEEGARGDGNLLALSVDAARARATLGEISQALENVFGRYDTSPTPVSGIYGQRSDAAWKAAVEGTGAVTSRLGRKPKMFVAKMGQDGHDRGANLVSSAFGDLGFEIVAGPLFQTPKEAARMAIDEDVDVVGASSLAAGHKSLIPELIQHLKDEGRGDIKVIAGGVIPQQDYAFLRDKGVQAIFGPGTNLADAAAQVLSLLGHNMPPVDGEEAAE
ncbi:MAG: methylmalonyl-CoA mutase family protein, partial [Phormidesmis sp.]